VMLQLLEGHPAPLVQIPFIDSAHVQIPFSPGMILRAFLL
jgi:hypothetical protein